MAALNYLERVTALNQGEPTRRRLEGALAKTAKVKLRVPGQPAGHVELARGVLNAPDAYAYRFGVAALTEPVFDAVENVNDITDGQLQGTVEELWPLFAPPPAE